MMEKTENIKAQVLSVWTLTPLPKPLTYLWFGAPLVRGQVVYVPLGTREVLAVVWDEISEASEDLKAIIRPANLPILSEKLLKFLEKMSAYTLNPLGQVLKLALRVEEPKGQGPLWLKPLSTTDKLSPKQKALHDWLLELHRFGIDPKGIKEFSRTIILGLVEKGGAEWIEPPEMIDDLIIARKDQALSPAQSEASRRAISAEKPVLLMGVTGSGKTEVYFEVIANILAKGKQALVLLPEIALTDQFIVRCQQRFGVTPGHWHSNMAKKARREVWLGVATGKLRVVVGARSALFLPFRELGIIVIDEEHDGAYKQDEGVIYHGRDMAVLRGSIEGAKILLASATPSVETMHNARLGKYQLVELTERFGQAVLPLMKISDMRQAGLDSTHWIGGEMREEISKRMSLGEQSLLFLNRRGFAPLTLCRACGHQMGCPHCDARLVEHRSRGKLQCHQCGYEVTKPKACPECGVEGRLLPVGPGVERLGEEVKEIFPEAKICVLSSDLVQNDSQIRDELQAIARGAYDIIIGTQMIAKGHNFPRLTLVGIIDADIGLEGGDLRAAERAFQLLRQVSGRAGRVDRTGLALIQSYQPEHPLLASIIEPRDHVFYDLQIRERERGFAPPFSRYIGVVISSPDLAEAMTVARAMAADQELTQSAPHIRVFGPVIAPISRIRGRSRVRILLRMAKNTPFQDEVRAWRARVKSAGRVKIHLDVDPISFY